MFQRPGCLSRCAASTTFTGLNFGLGAGGVFPLLDSSNIAVGDWNKIGRVIDQHYDEFDGFVVLHGTDTMAYTASALSFMLENLNKPVVFTGSQIPLCMLRSDGLDNIVNAILIAASGRVHEVCLYFGGRLLRGNRSTKMSGRSAGSLLIRPMLRIWLRQASTFSTTTR